MSEESSQLEDTMRSKFFNLDRSVPAWKLSRFWLPSIVGFYNTCKAPQWCKYSQTKTCAFKVLSYVHWDWLQINLYCGWKNRLIVQYFLRFEDKSLRHGAYEWRRLFCLVLVSLSGSFFPWIRPVPSSAAGRTTQSYTELKHCWSSSILDPLNDYSLTAGTVNVVLNPHCWEGILGGCQSAPHKQHISAL